MYSGVKKLKTKVGIIDIGSTSIRLVILKVNQNGSYGLIDQAKEAVRLSAGLNRTGKIHPEMMQQALSTLYLFQQLCVAHGVSKVIAVATAATRQAENGTVFLQMIQEKLGIEATVITGETEAYLDYLAVVNTIALDSFIVVDVGGGSTELVYVKERQFKAGVSLPFGAMILGERFDTCRQLNREQLAALNDYVTTAIEGLGFNKELTGLPIVALGGSARTMAKIDKHSRQYPLEGLHNYQLSPTTANEIYNGLAGMPVVQRKNVAGLAKDRADIILGGLAPIVNLAKSISAPAIYISGNGIREGLFYQYYLKELHQTEPVVPDVLDHSLENILLNFDVNIDHSRHVQKLALQLFDQLQPIHGLDDSCRRALKTGSLLHDIGRVINYYNHHAHSFYLILNSRLHGLNHREKVMAAFIAGYHDASSFKVNVQQYQQLLQDQDQQVIRQLALFAQIAELLDRSHCGCIKQIHCHCSGDDVQIMLSTQGAAHPEYIAIEETKKPFEKLFRRKLYYI